MASEVAGVTNVPTFDPAFFFPRATFGVFNEFIKEWVFVGFLSDVWFHVVDTNILLQKFIRNVYHELAFQHVEIPNGERNIRWTFNQLLIGTLNETRSNPINSWLNVQRILRSPLEISTCWNTSSEREREIWYESTCRCLSGLVIRLTLASFFFFWKNWHRTHANCWIRDQDGLLDEMEENCIYN